MKKIIFIIRSFTIACLLSSPAFAVDNYWDGSSGDSNWDTAANWSLNTVPTTSNDNVVFNSTGASYNIITLGAAQTHGIWFDSPGVSYTLGSSSDTLTVANNDTGGKGDIQLNNNVGSYNQTIAANINMTTNLQLMNFNTGTGVLLITGNITNTGSNGTLALGYVSGGEVNNAGDNKISGQISDGTGTVAVNVNVGKWVLSGNNTYTGATTVTGGILNIQSANALGGTGNGTSVASGAALQIQGGITTAAEALTLNGTGVSNDGALRNISDNNIYAGLVTLGSATRINSDSGTLTLSNTGTITGSGFSLTVGGSGNTTINSIIGTGTSGTLIKDGSGTLTLNGANTHKGGTQIQAGTVKIGSGGKLSGGGDASSVSSGATLDLNGNSITTSNEVLSIAGSGVDGKGALCDNVGGSTWSGHNIYLTDDARINCNVAGTTLTIGSTTHLLQLQTYDLTVGGVGDIVISRAITGTDASGTLTKDGTGTLTLSKANTYTGATTVNAGTLKAGVATSAFGSLSAVTVNLGALLSLNNYSETIGSLAGAGTVNNGGASDKTLTAGGDNTSTTFSGTIADGAVGKLIFTKSGTGTLSLSGANTYTGTTTITGGTLQIGDSGASGTLGTGEVTNNSALKFNRSDDITVDNAISGTGTLEQAGTGTLTINRSNSYSGSTTITRGVVQVGDSTALGTGNLINNATLDVGTTNLTLAATKGYTQSSNSTLSLTVNSASTYGKITTGSAGATIAADSTVNVTVGGYIANNTSLTIINTEGAGIDNAPVTVISSNPFMTFSSALSGNNLILTAIRSGSNSFAGASTTANGAAVGGVLDNVINPSTAMQTVLTALGNSTSAQVASSENSMTPTNDGALTQSAQAMLNNFTNNTMTHLENVRTTGGATGIATGDDYLKGVDIWAQGLGDYAHQDPRGSSQGYNATSWGISGGADKSLFNDQIRIGLGSGYGQTFVNSKDFSGTTDINSIPATIYCDYTNNNLPYYIDAAFTFIYNMYTGSRQVTAGPTITNTANADYDGEQYSGYIEGGYSFFYKKISLTPLASFQYMHLHTSGYTETNAGALNLSVAAQDYDMAQTGIGAKLACPFQNKYGILTPDLHFKWLYDWVGDKQATSAGFNGGGTSFGTNGFSPAQSAYDFGAKLNFKTKYNVTIGLDYDFLFKTDYYEHYGTIDVKYSF